MNGELAVSGKTNPQNQRDHVGALFVQHVPQIRRFILNLVPDMVLADDVLQETYLTVSKKADEFTRGSNFLAWACTIARYKVFEESRRNLRTGKILSTEALNAVCSAAPEVELFDTQERLEALNSCIGRLSPHAKQAFELRYHNAHSTSEIAKILGWTVGSVCVILSRGRKTLRDCVATKLRLKENGF